MKIIYRMFPLLTAVLMLLTSAVNAVFVGDVYKPEYISSTVGFETLTRSQGITNDGKSFIFSGKTSLEKTDLDCRKILAVNTDAIPAQLKENYSSKHIGGISCCEGIIYAGVEDSKEWKHPLVVLYDAETLEYTGEFHEISTDIQKRGIPWVSADGENGILYTGDSRNYDEIFKFDLHTFEYLGSITLSVPVEKIQGGEYYMGKLYVGTNDIKRAVYTVDVKTGEVEKLFDRISYEYRYIENFGGEGEDITVLPLDDGTYIHALNIGSLFIDSRVRHYKYKS